MEEAVHREKNWAHTARPTHICSSAVPDSLIELMLKARCRHGLGAGCSRSNSTCLDRMLGSANCAAMLVKKKVEVSKVQRYVFWVDHMVGIGRSLMLAR